MESRLEDFLLERAAVTPSVLEEMKEQKIDMKTVLHMTYDQLEKYIPKVGDQIAVTNFCRRHRFTTPSCSKTTLSLIQKLKRGNSEENISTEELPSGSKKQTIGRPVQDSRKIKLGWKMNGKMVREIRGGGCRNITVKKTMTKKDLIKEALNVFFPNGYSKFGPLKDFTYDLLDYQENPILENVTVRQMYTVSKLTSLRFYLATNANCNAIEPSKKRKCTATRDKSDPESLPQKKNRKPTECASTSSENVEDPMETLNEFLTFNSDNDSIPKDSKYYSSQFEDNYELQTLFESVIDDNTISKHNEDLSEVTSVTDATADINESFFKRDLEIAMNNSLASHKKESNLTDNRVGSLEGILGELNRKVQSKNCSKFNIYRADIFQCCIRALRRKNFSPFNKISVMFSDVEGVTEGAADAGGPTREMFRLVINHIKNSRMFFGEKKKYITLDAEALQKQEYLEAGRLIALSVIHGGPGPHFFSKNLYSLVVIGFSKDYITLNDVEYEIREKISKVSTIDALETLQQYVEEEPIFAIAGWPIITKIEDKDRLVEDLIKFYAYDRVRPALEQLQEGLNTGNLLELIRQHPKVFEDIMCGDNIPLSADIMNELFKVNYSVSDSSQRQLENKAITFWRDFLLDCEDAEVGPSLEDVMAFATGADRVPPLGFDVTPTISFEKDAFYATANTCGLELRLPIKHATYEEFKSNVSFGISNAPHFGYA